jgi:hypothetical protein
MCVHMQVPHRDVRRDVKTETAQGRVGRYTEGIECAMTGFPHSEDERGVIAAQ